jgi:bis(5'-nucleosidyl)-tetraphosphatase
MNRERRQHSAGFIVFRDGESGREYLVMRDRNYWSFPKGHLEAGESELDAAHREVREEVGLIGARPVSGFRRELRYSLGATSVEKCSVYFLARCPDELVLEPAEVSEVQWLGLEAALPLLGFDETRQMLRDADAFLEAAATGS